MSGSFVATMLAALLGGASGSAFAQSSHDAMTGHGKSEHMMSHGGKHDSMTKSGAMKHDSMKSDAMSKSSTSH